MGVVGREKEGGREREGGREKYIYREREGGRKRGREEEREGERGRDGVSTCVHANYYSIYYTYPPFLSENTYIAKYIYIYIYNYTPLTLALALALALALQVPRMRTHYLVPCNNSFHHLSANYAK